MAIKHISREEAVLQARLWVAEDGLTVEECAKRLGLTRTTLYTWIKAAGRKYTVKAAAILPVEE